MSDTTFSGRSAGRNRQRFTAEDLNALQGAGVISDLCVGDADVAIVDRQRALRWLDFTAVTAGMPHRKDERKKQ